MDSSVAVTVAAHTGLGTMPIVMRGTRGAARRWVPDLAAGRRLGGDRAHRAGGGLRRRRLPHPRRRPRGRRLDARRREDVHHQRGHRHHRVLHGHRPRGRRRRQPVHRPGRRARLPARAAAAEGGLAGLGHAAGAPGRGRAGAGGAAGAARGRACARRWPRSTAAASRSPPWASGLAQGAFELALAPRPRAAPVRAQRSSASRPSSSRSPRWRPRSRRRGACSTRPPG